MDLRYISEVESARIGDGLDLEGKEEGSISDDFHFSGLSSRFDGGIIYWDVEYQAWMGEGVEKIILLWPY